MASVKNEMDPAGSFPLSGKRILIVDDDHYFRMLLEKCLLRSRCLPALAEGAKHAQQMIGLDEFDLVISDIRMPEMDGVQLLRWVKENTKLPVILMTGFSEIPETQAAAEVGADGFLAKPFKTEELLRVIADCLLEPTKELEEESLDPQFCKISIDDFISGKEMKFDIFVRITEKKYIKIAHGGENLPMERIQSYKSKDIRFLHMRKDDFGKYLGFNLALTKAVTGSAKIAHAKKVNFIKHTSEVLLQSLHLNEISEENFLQARVLVENAVSLLSEDTAAADLLVSLSSHTDFLYAHSVGVSLYSSMIARALKWTAPATIFKISVGGLLHDIGKKEIPREVLEKPRVEMTPDDVYVLESHPIRGAELLARLPCIPADVLQIAHQHHENALGFGYPSGLKKNKIHPMARVVAVANEFCGLVIKNPNSVGIGPAEAIQRMLSLNPEHAREEAVQALARIFGVSI